MLRTMRHVKINHSLRKILFVKMLLPWLKLLRLNAVGFNGEDGGDGRANEEALPADVAALEDSREPNISDGENNLDEPVTFA